MAKFYATKSGTARRAGIAKIAMQAISSPVIISSGGTSTVTSGIEQFTRYSSGSFDTRYQINVDITGSRANEVEYTLSCPDSAIATLTGNTVTRVSDGEARILLTSNSGSRVMRLAIARTVENNRDLFSNYTAGSVPGQVEAITDAILSGYSPGNSAQNAFSGLNQWSATSIIAGCSNRTGLMAWSSRSENQSTTANISQQRIHLFGRCRFGFCVSHYEFIETPEEQRGRVYGMQAGYADTSNQLHTDWVSDSWHSINIGPLSSGGHDVMIVKFNTGFENIIEPMQFEDVAGWRSAGAQHGYNLLSIDQFNRVQNYFYLDTNNDRVINFHGWPWWTAIKNDSGSPIYRIKNNKLVCVKMISGEEIGKLQQTINDAVDLMGGTSQDHLTMI